MSVDYLDANVNINRELLFLIFSKSILQKNN